MPPTPSARQCSTLGIRLAHVPLPSPVEPLPLGDVYASALSSRIPLSVPAHAGAGTAGCHGAAARCQEAPSVHATELQSGATVPLMGAPGALEKSTLSSEPLTVPTPVP